MAGLDLRLRVTTPGLLALPWREPLEAWDPTVVPMRDLPVGPSRHLVRFVEADGRLWALKALPRRTAAREYEVLREMEARTLSAVRAAGVVVQPGDDHAVLVTHYLERSWQYRRLLMRIPATARVHRDRLFDAMVVLLVDLHRNGIYWGDCSLANTLFMRDGQTVQAWMVDAETAECHHRLSPGQRRADLDIMVENVAGGLLDVAARRGELDSSMPGVMDEAEGLSSRYDELWEMLFDEPVVPLADDPLSDDGVIGARVRRLQATGFTLDEVQLEDAPGGGGRVRVRAQAGGRRFHAEQVLRLTGMEVGEGQASILLEDIRAHRRGLEREVDRAVPDHIAARAWLVEVFEPTAARAHAAVGGRGDDIQAYCDLLEVRWLLSEQAGHDVGDDVALSALSAREAPQDSAASMAFVEDATEQLPRIPPPAG